MEKFFRFFINEINGFSFPCFLFYLSLVSYLDSLPLLSYSIDCLHLLLINFLGSVPNQLPPYKYSRFSPGCLLSLSVLLCDIPGFPFQCFGLFRAPFGFSIFIFGSPF